MQEITGKFNKAKVYATTVEQNAYDQIENMCNMEIYKDNRIAIMPDVHAGAGCTIGTTMTLNGAVSPNMVGVDIGCGMEVCQIKEKEIDFDKLDKLIREEIPFGREVRTKTHPYSRDIDLYELKCSNKIKKLGKESWAIGSLGGGNHFIEVDKDDEGNLYIVVHSGSRHLGKRVAEVYQELAFKQCNGNSGEDVKELIENLKKEGRQKEIETILQNMKKERETVPKMYAYVSGELFTDYIHDMKIMQKFAVLNRKAMMDIIIEGMNLTVVDNFTTIHNYIDTENMILRKGAVSAQKGEKLLIPINMKEGSLICIGKGNPEWNCSAPHGAGRLFSRKEAFRRFTVEEFTKQMEGIYSTTVTASTLDECPMAYKNMDEIVKNIEPTTEIIKVIKPIYNFKAEE